MHLEDVYDEDNDVNLRNTAPLNKNRVLELSDGSDDEPPAKKIVVSDDSEEDDEGPNEESPEDELSMLFIKTFDQQNAHI